MAVFGSTWVNFTLGNLLVKHYNSVCPENDKPEPTMIEIAMLDYLMIGHTERISARETDFLHIGSITAKSEPLKEKFHSI